MFDKGAISVSGPEDPGVCGTRPQAAALCFVLAKGKPHILLITSRATGRWVLPKGWPIIGLTAAEAAAREAYEEAGVLGAVSETCIGQFFYLKQIPLADSLPCLVSVYPLRVQKLRNDFPEQGERQRQWFSPEKAATLVAEPELQGILRAFDPAMQALAAKSSHRKTPISAKG